MENLVCCMEHWNSLITKMLLIKTLKYWDSTTALKTLKKLQKTYLWETIIYQNYIFVKGYLRYKTITFQNVSFEAQIKNFFLSEKNYVPFSRYSSFCIFEYPMIYQICDMMSISAWDKVYILIYLLNHNS